MEGLGHESPLGYVKVCHMAGPLYMPIGLKWNEMEEMTDSPIVIKENSFFEQSEHGLGRVLDSLNSNE